MTFCVAGTPCSQIQHAILTRCVSNCEDCSKDATNTVVADCVVSDGARAADLITTECDMGQPCSGIQTAIAARCFASCAACDLVATGTVVGACTEPGHGSAMSMIHETCTYLTGPDDFTPCSTVQTGLRDECISDCSSCDVETVLSNLRSCTLPDGSVARDGTCATTVPPPPPRGPVVCTSLQTQVIQQCSNDCSGCNTATVGSVVAGCTP